MVKVTNAKNAINHLWDEQGNKVVEVEHIKKVATDYYKNLLGHSNHVFDDSKAARVRSLLRKKITKDQKMEMQKEVSEDEIRRTILAMNSSKASGPDGYSAGFFKAAWPTVRKDVVGAVKSFFLHG